MPVPPAPPRPGAPLAHLRQDLRAFTHDAVAAVVGEVALAALDREQAPPARRAARRSTEAAAVLARVFMLGDAVTRGELDRALPTTGTDGARKLGLVAAAGAAAQDEVRALVDLQPYEAADASGTARWWLASDLGELATGAELDRDHVLGVGGASLTLAQLTARRPARRVLDLGTGCGIQALHATRHADTVVATDVSARALAFADFNAQLAGESLDLRQGSLFEPVAGEQFDLVVSNPPFVITPAAAYAAGLPVMSYRDAAREGDSLVADVVGSLGAHLAPGGVAQLLGNWEHHDGEGWRDRVAGWAAAAGLDCWIVQRELQDPAEYAYTWLRDGGARPGDARFDDVLAAWLDDFEARGVRGVGFGYLLLRRPIGRPTPGRVPGLVDGGPDGALWSRIEALSGPVRQPLGVHIGEVLAAYDWLAAHDDDELAAARLVLAEDVTEERHYRPGEPDPRVLLLRQGGGLGRTVQPGTLVAGAVGACDGELTLGQVMAGLAVVLDQPADAVAAEVLPAMRGLVLDGFLAPAALPGA